MDLVKLQQQASNCLENAQYLEAIALYEQCIEAEPFLVANYWYLGLALLLQGEESEAQSVWLSVLAQASPEEIEQFTLELLKILESAAVKFLQEGYEQKAEIIYRQAIELNPNDVRAYYNLGTALGRLEKWEEAIASLQQAIELKPDFVEAYHNLGYLYQQLEQYENATVYYSKVIELQPNDYQTYYWLGVCLAEQEKFNEAIACFQKVNELQPDYVDAYFNCADALLKLGKINEAIACLQKAIQIKPIFAKAYLDWYHSLGKNNLVKPKVNLRASFFEALIARKETQGLYFYLGKQLSECSQIEAAKYCFQKALEIQPSLTEASEELKNLENGDGEKSKSRQLNLNIPKGFYKNTAEWAIKSNNDRQNSDEIKYIKINPKHQINIFPPKALDRSIYSYLKNTKFESPETFLAIIPEGRVWLAQNATAIVTSDNLLLRDISPHYPFQNPGNFEPDDFRQNPIFSMKNLPPIHHLDETVAIIPGIGAYNYFHWMIDILPSLGLLYESSIDVANIEKFLINGYKDLPFQRESLSLLGMSQSQIINNEQYPHIQAKKLVVPSLPGHVSCATKWSCNYIRNLFFKQNKLEKTYSKERLYISRKNASKRQVINEDEVVSFLEQFGFKSVILESMPLIEQISLFAAAEAIVSPHGAGLTNIVFCNPETKIIEIVPENFVRNSFCVIANHVDLDFYRIRSQICESIYLSKLVYIEPDEEDILVNINSLLETMTFAGLIF